MKEPHFSPPILSCEDINTYAEDFLRDHHADNTLPIPIEEILEFDLGLDIVPFPSLQRDFDIDGFISGDLTCIYVDDFIHQNRPSRYRFTLAHEIGHLVLHKDLIESFRPLSIGDWKNFVLQVDDEVYDWLEWQAYTFAGLLLVPRRFLSKDFSLQIEALKSKIELVKSKNLPKDSYQEYIVNAVANKLIRTYDVSIYVLIKRISKEIEKGIFTIP
ncbi:MAG: ImmA/IrrE family metallo-endopeptidase [Nitrospirae bacterium]|nr:ImmA/IrrE family metallo-endopeptidase [Nitrospirota bacterium]